MSEKNKMIVKKMIDQSSQEESEFFISHIDENICWNIVGMPGIRGKKQFIEMLNSLHLKNFSLDGLKNIIAEGEFVVVECFSEITGNSICDIYHLKDEKLMELTTYIVDTSSNA